MPSFTRVKLNGDLSSAPARIQFSLDGVPEREHPSLLRRALGNQSTYEPEPLPDVPPKVDFEFHTLPGLMMMQGIAHGVRTTRSRTTLVATPTDDVDLLVNLSGPFQVTHGKEELALRTGEAVLVSLADVYSFVHRPPGGLLALRIPRRQLAPLVTGVEDCCWRAIPESTPALKLLIDYVKVARNGPIMACDLQHLVVKHVQDLMAVMVGATRDAAATAQGGGLRAARLHMLKENIAENLDQPELSVASLARRHGLTERYVQRLFETDGSTFTEYVLDQRLQRAHRALIDPRREDEKISTVAWDFGFGDVSYFNRVFRRRYGLAPSDVRARARQGDVTDVAALSGRLRN